MFKEAINIGKARFKQKHTAVTDDVLESIGFSELRMGDLLLHEIADQYYYVNPKGKLTLIKNEYILSNLVYGKIKYERSVN